MAFTVAKSKMHVGGSGLASVVAIVQSHFSCTTWVSLDIGLPGTASPIKPHISFLIAGPLSHILSQTKVLMVFELGACIPPNSKSTGFSAVFLILSGSITVETHPCPPQSGEDVAGDDT